MEHASLVHRLTLVVKFLVSRLHLDVRDTNLRAFYVVRRVVVVDPGAIGVAHNHVPIGGSLNTVIDLTGGTIQPAVGIVGIGDTDSSDGRGENVLHIQAHFRGVWGQM